MKNRRRRKLIRPDIQIRGITFALLLALGTVTIQSIALMVILNQVAVAAPTDGPAILQALPRLLALSAAVSFALLTPLILALTLNESHRVAGPIYRIEQHLRAHLNGEATGPLQLRRRDQLKDVAELVERTVDQAREAQATAGERPAA